MFKCSKGKSHIRMISYYYAHAHLAASCCIPSAKLMMAALEEGSLVPRLFGGGGKKEPGIYCLRMRLIILTFQSFWISPGTSVLCWHHQPISRTLNFTLEKWIARFCTLFNASAVFCDFERWTNSLRPGHLWRKGHIYLAAYRSWQVNVLWNTTLCVSYWSSTKTTQERIHVERRSFTTICMYVALHYPRRFVIVRHRGPSHLTFT